MPRRKADEVEAEAVENPQVEAVEEVEAETGEVGFVVVPDNRWNTIQCAGIGFSKSQPTVLSLSDPRLEEVRSCQMLQEA